MVNLIEKTVADGSGKVEGTGTYRGNNQRKARRPPSHLLRYPINLLRVNITVHTIFRRSVCGYIGHKIRNDHDEECG